MQKQSNLFKSTKKILKEIRFGNLSGRLNPQDFPEDISFVNDFNNMLETINDRENMINEYKTFMFEQSEYLKTLFNLLNEGAMTLSEDFKILTINDTLAKWFRKSKNKLINLSISELLKKYTIKDLRTNKLISDYNDFLSKDKKNYNLLFQFKKIEIAFSISVKKFLDKENKRNYFIVAKNITTDVNLQKLKDTFTATLTHDLKVPIIAEAKVLELLLKETFGKNTQSQKEAFLNMQANNNDMMNLVQTLLDTYKFEESIYELHFEKTNIIKLLENEIEKLKFLADDNNCTIKFKTTKKSQLIAIDTKEIARVIKNILTNAINFAPENTEILVEIETSKSQISVSITNNGKPIKQEEIGLIFDRYYTTAKKYRKVGTGLGLYLSKKIIDLHGGNIVVKSSQEKGTTFSVLLPLNIKN